MSQVFHLYIHLPFCPRRCSYCDFYSEPGRLELAPAYIDALLNELEEFDLPAGQLKTVYLGGGTPTFIDGGLLNKLLMRVLPFADKKAEVTIEANPSTITSDLAQTLRAGGVTRVSMGAQSFIPRLRKNLGRAGRIEAIGRAMSCLRRAGFNNVGLDLIFGIPGQAVEDLRRDLESALALQPDHISCYELTLKEESLLRRRWAVELEEMDKAGTGRLFYETAVDTLEAAGYVWYETSNFALPGYECRHNLAYWEGEDYIGIGAGAWSTVERNRWRNAEDLDMYVAKHGSKTGGEDRPGSATAGPGSSGHRSFERLSRKDKLHEKLLLGLRRAQGVPASAVASTVDPSAQNLLQRNGFLVTEGDKMLLTRAGRFVANEVCARLLKC